MLLKKKLKFIIVFKENILKNKDQIELHVIHPVTLTDVCFFYTHKDQEHMTSNPIPIILILILTNHYSIVC